MSPGVAEWGTHTDVRRGTSSLSAALDIATGALIGKCYKRHRAPSFSTFSALLHQSADSRGSPFPGKTYLTASVKGMPIAVKSR